MVTYLLHTRGIVFLTLLIPAPDDEVGVVLVVVTLLLGHGHRVRGVAGGGVISAHWAWPGSGGKHEAT